MHGLNSGCLPTTGGSIVLFRLLSSTAFVLIAGAAPADYALTILHTNDFHDRYEPITGNDNTCAPEDNVAGKCFGGSARLVTALAEARARNPDTILVDGGDQFQGTLFYTRYKGTMTAEFINSLGYDAMTVGNHEFDDGPEVLAAFVAGVTFPVLMSNADISGEPILAGKIAKSTVIERNGQKIGLIGLTPQDTDQLASPGKNVIFTDPVGAVQGEVDVLTEAGINKIIVLSHSGYVVDQVVAAGTTGVDVIVGGHSNTYLSNISDDAAGPYPTMVGTTAIVSAYAFGKFLGDLNVVFNDEGQIVTATGEPRVMYHWWPRMHQRWRASPNWRSRWQRSGTGRSPRRRRNWTDRVTIAGRSSAPSAILSPRRCWTGCAIRA